MRKSLDSALQKMRLSLGGVDQKLSLSVFLTAAPTRLTQTSGNGNMRIISASILGNVLLADIAVKSGLNGIAYYGRGSRARVYNC